MASHPLMKQVCRVGNETEYLEYLQGASADSQVHALIRLHFKEDPTMSFRNEGTVSTLVEGRWTDIIHILPSSIKGGDFSEDRQNALSFLTEIAGIVIEDNNHV